MGKTVKQMLAEIDSHELTEHMIDYAMEPWGEERADYRAGLIAAVINNVNATDKKYMKTAQDFMPFYKPEDESPDDVGERLLEALKKYG